MTETRPEESVVPLAADRLPALAPHITVLSATGLPSEVSVAVRVLDPPGCRVKLEGDIDIVEDSITTVIVPEEPPLLA